MSEKAKCISCEFAVMEETKPSQAVCWKEGDEQRKPKNALIERKCGFYKLGPMAQVRSRREWKP